MTRAVIACVLLASVGFGCRAADVSDAGPAPRTLPYYDSADFTPRWQVDNDASFHRIRPFRLSDQQGQAFTEAGLAGRIAVVDFFFTTCPAICPRMAVSMKALQREFLDDNGVLLVSHSVTPDTDTAAVLADYAEAHGVEYRRWKLLTGEKREVYDLGRRYYFVDEDLGGARNEDDFLHTENFVLIDPARRIRGIYNGLDPDSIRSLIADIRVLQAEVHGDTTTGGSHRKTSRSEVTR